MESTKSKTMQISLEVIVNLAYRDGFICGAIDLNPEQREDQRKAFIATFTEIEPKFTDDNLRLLTYSWYKGRYERRRFLKLADEAHYRHFCTMLDARDGFAEAKRYAGIKSDV